MSRIRMASEVADLSRPITASRSLKDWYELLPKAVVAEGDRDTAESLRKEGRTGRRGDIRQ
jgi:hypothetical protein